MRQNIIRGKHEGLESDIDAGFVYCGLLLRLHGVRPGRPGKDREIRQLIRRMADSNPLWGAPRVHGELLKLEIDISERTVSRWMPKRRKPRRKRAGTIRQIHLISLRQP